MGSVGNQIHDAVGQAGNFFGLGGAGAVNVSGYMPSDQEKSFMAALTAQMNGNGPNPANLQMQQGLSQANSNAAAQAAAQRGVSPGLAAQLAARAQSANAQSVAQNAGIMNAQQQLNTEGIMGNMYASERQSAGEANKLQNSAQQATYSRIGGLLNQSGGSSMLSGIMGGGGGGAGGTMMAGGAGDAGIGGAAVMAAAHGGKVRSLAHYLAMQTGGPVPGRANVEGDSPKNDTVPAMLSPGEVVVPRSKANDPEKAKEFIEHLKKQKSGESQGYAGVAEAKRKLQEVMKHLEKVG